MDANSSATFGDLLRRYRLAADLTQEELAERAGVSLRGISDLERGRRTHPWRETVQSLAAALRLEPPERAQFTAAGRRQNASSGDARRPLSAPERAGPRNNLPVSLTPLIGREREITAVVALLRRSDVRLVTLTGPGGIGKTRLALQVAAGLSKDFPDGVFFVSLAAIGDPSLVAPAIARVLDVRESDGRPLIEQVQETLRGRQVLVVLDNFEHIAAAAGLVGEFLVECPQLHVLVTSRAPLHLRGEHEFAVPALTLPVREATATSEQLTRYEAVRLFVERARADRADFDLTDESALAVAEICARVDGLPLAIELAAARTRLLSPQTLLTRLDPRLPLLTSHAPDRPARHQTMRAAIAWSYDLLDECEQALFRRLAIFVGGFTLDAALAVGGEGDVQGAEPLDRIESLVRKSLLRRSEGAGETRLSMLETIHEYGLGELAASGEGDAVGARHATYYLGMAEKADRQYTTEGTGSMHWDVQLTSEEANLRTALEWYRNNHPALGLQLAAALGWYWVFHRDLEDGEEWLATFLDQTPGTPGIRGRAVLALATLLRDRGDLAAAQPLFEESLALCQQVGDKWGVARCVIQLAQQMRSRSEYEGAIFLAEESLAIAREIRVQDSIIWGLNSLLQLHWLNGDNARARVFAEEALRLSPQNTTVRYHLGMIFLGEGEYNRAEVLLEEVVREARAGRSRQYLSSVVRHLGRVAHRRGDHIRARRLFEESIALAQDIGHARLVCRTLNSLARLALTEGDHIEASRTLAEEITLARQIESRWDIIQGLLFSGVLAAASGVWVQATRILSASVSLDPKFDTYLDASERADHQQSLAAGQASLGADAFAAAWAEGQEMTLEQAVDFALNEDDIARWV